MSSSLDVPAVEVRPVATAHGEARLHRNPALGRPLATLLLGHGAGNGVEMHDLAGLADALPAQDVGVVRLEQPWRVAGRKVATAPPTLDVALEAAVRALPADDLAAPLVLGGRSAGARSAARCAGRLGAAGAVLIAFPLHPPGRPEKSRRAELDALVDAGVPTLVVQGERDAFGGPDELATAYGGELPAGVDLVVVPDADHGLKVRRSAGITVEDVRALVVEAVLEWIVREVGGPGATVE
ncbi:alpha/beta family hydrolase [Nocardioides zeae]|uniref:Alpha/beta family hydrolase n=1 Tax=Nocardioides imazamoxiresistens TaxID=3231893 RepID=A0ABU3PWU7_9ACTN|nr:alpha/beta family hydrolase [Nocardioides zeae]MDT9593713.1 alpha/beta family hydrolase [Nocardioides zeae]